MWGADQNLVIKTKPTSTVRKKWHIKFECYKLQNKNKKTPANHKGKQPEKSGEASVAEDDYNDEKFLVVSNANSKPCEDWILD